MRPPETPHQQDLADELRAVLKAGLPVRLERCGPGLLALRGARARALQPEDPPSVARALDALLREQLDRLENTELGGAARLLFGAEASTSGATLTARRTAAAQAAGFEVHHFRKRIEPKLLTLVAWQLQRDSEAFTARHAEPPKLTARSDVLQLPADVFAWEAAEHQQAIVRLWAAVYGLRAELLHVAQLVSMTTDIEETTSAANAALWRHAIVLAATEHYQTSYGAVLLHAATELGPADVASFAGWTPSLTDAQKRLLVDCVDDEDGRAIFIDRLAAAPDGEDLITTWQLALTGQARTGPKGQTA